jgi:hypothetical protein
MSYIILRGRRCHIIVLNVHAPTEDKTDDVKDSFYEKLGRWACIKYVNHHFPFAVKIQMFFSLFSVVTGDFTSGERDSCVT